MSIFKGFSSRTEYVAVPAAFLSQLLSSIDDINELKTILYFFKHLTKKKGFPRHVTFSELAGDAGLVSAIKSEKQSKKEIISEVLNKAETKGVVLHVTIRSQDSVEDVYLLNTEKDKQILTRIESGEIKIGDIQSRARVEQVVEPTPNIFTLYEQNIGLLTPIIAEELKDAEKIYPEEWIREAIGEAVKANKRGWRYILKILERWATEGKADGTYRRDFKTTDPDRFVRGRYGHLFQR